MARLKPGQYKGGKLVDKPQFEEPKKKKNVVSKLSQAELITRGKSGIIKSREDQFSETFEAPTGVGRSGSNKGLTLAGDIREEDVLPQFREQLGFGDEKTGGAAAPTAGFTPINDIRVGDVLSEFREQMGFEDASKKGLLNIVFGQGIGDKITGMFTPKGIPEDAQMGTAPLIGGLGKAVKAAGATKNALKNIKNFQLLKVNVNLPQIGKLTTNTQRIASNTKTVKLTLSYYEKFTRTLKHPFAVIGMLGAAIGSYPWTGHLRIDTVAPTYSIPIRDMQDRGLDEEAAILQEQYDEFLYPPLLENVINILPIINLIKVTYFDGIKAARLNNEANKVINEHLRQARETGEDMYSIGRQEKADLERETAIINDAVYTEGKKERLALQSDYDNARDKKERKIILNNIKLWDDADAAKTERAAEERAAIAAFWLAYQRELQKMFAENRPSSLSFGLL